MLKFLESVLAGIQQARPARLHPEIAANWLHAIPMGHSVSVDIICEALHQWPVWPVTCHLADLREVGETVHDEQNRQAFAESTIQRILFSIDVLNWDHEDFPKLELGGSMKEDLEILMVDYWYKNWTLWVALKYPNAAVKMSPGPLS